MPSQPAPKGPGYFTVHNPKVRRGSDTLYMSHYAEGVVVLDSGLWVFRTRGR